MQYKNKRGFFYNIDYWVICKVFIIICHSHKFASSFLLPKWPSFMTYKNKRVLFPAITPHFYAIVRYRRAGHFACISSQYHIKNYVATHRIWTETFLFVNGMKYKIFSIVFYRSLIYFRMNTFLLLMYFCNYIVCNFVLLYW